MLPIVHQDLITSTLHSINERFNSDIYNKINDENPILAALIKAVLDSDKTEDFKDGYCKAAAQFYYLLDAQMECDSYE